MSVLFSLFIRGHFAGVAIYSQSGVIRSKERRAKPALNR